MPRKLTTEEFIAKSKAIYGDQFDYSKAEYVNKKTKVELICKKCGATIFVLPSRHVHNKFGCPYCSRRKTKEQFAEEARKIHGDKYDYSKVEYVNNSTKVIVSCPKHGDFLISPANHLHGRGCPKCARELINENSSNNSRKTKEQFIIQAKQVHGDKYDYSKVNYINNNTKVEIICKNCQQSFWQRPSDHLHGYGCSVCSSKKRLTTEEFIRRAKEIHGDRYDYSKVNYKNYSTKVCIICKICGCEFWQEPRTHLCAKAGCPSCFQTKKKTKEQFIEEARKIHGDKYDYSKVNYIDTDTKVCIICPKHEEFWQTPYQHLSLKNGCPVCNESHGESTIRTYLIEHNINFESQKKFDDCRNINPLPFDFYVSEYNLCIEYQGEQHYKPIDFFGGEEQFKIRQINDSIKKDWCSKENTPNLLEIKYTDEIKNVLNTFFQ